MRYATENYPYDRPPEQMTPGALRKVLAAILESMQRRIGYISEFLFEAHGAVIAPDSPDETLDRLPALIASVGRMADLTDEELQARFAATKPEVAAAFKSVFASQELDGQTLGMVFDAALLWGEAFRVRYPEVTWALGGKPKSSVNFGDPVLILVDKPRAEFNPLRELHGHVGSILLNDPHTWTLSKIMKMRAFQFGLGPDPRPESERTIYRPR